jgi:hypothetical protein
MVRARFTTSESPYFPGLSSSRTSQVARWCRMTWRAVGRSIRPGLRAGTSSAVHHYDVAADLLVPGENHLPGKLGVGHHALFHLRAGEDGLDARIPQERLRRVFDLDLVELALLDQPVIKRESDSTRRLCICLR